MNNDELVTISYLGQELLVSKEIANFLDDFRRLLERQRNEKRRHISRDEFDEEYPLAATPDFVDSLLRNMERYRLRNAVELLPEHQKRRLTAYFFDGLTYREIAQSEGVSVSAVHKSIQSALKSLKIIFY